MVDIVVDNEVIRFIVISFVEEVDYLLKLRTISKRIFYPDGTSMWSENMWLQRPFIFKEFAARFFLGRQWVFLLLYMFVKRWFVNPVLCFVC